MELVRQKKEVEFQLNSFRYKREATRGKELLCTLLNQSQQLRELELQSSYRFESYWEPDEESIEERKVEPVEKQFDWT